MELNKQEVDQLLKVLFFVLSACAALTEERVTLESGTKPDPQVSEMAGVLTNLVPMGTVIMITKLLDKDEMIELGEYDNQLLALWLLKAKQESLGEADDT